MISLAGFAVEMKSYMDQFKQFWIDGNKQNKELFPLSMKESDWNEQFEFFVAQKRDGR